MLQIVYLKYLNKIMKNKEKIKVSSDCLIIDALKLMDSLSRKLLIVMDGKFFLSVLSIGDIQRAIINKVGPYVFAIIIWSWVLGNAFKNHEEVNTDNNDRLNTKRMFLFFFIYIIVRARL